ncbi:piggyBac transposable element-derived protein 3-like [Periplaneta americana]|uniref:piggyBac transposable element-derived protein 3-like n=1 Tax=Periplaneta americana TaxID=6978 RepID=UPI0037E8312B
MVSLGVYNIEVCIRVSYFLNVMLCLIRQHNRKLYTIYNHRHKSRVYSYIIKLFTYIYLFMVLLFIYSSDGLTLSELLDIIEANDDLANKTEDIFIVPPDVHVDTDEDSANEDEGGMIYNVTGRQLRAAAEIRLANNERIGGDYEPSDMSCSGASLYVQPTQQQLQQQQQQRPQQQTCNLIQQSLAASSIFLPSLQSTEQQQQQQQQQRPVQQAPDLIQQKVTASSVFPPSIQPTQQRQQQQQQQQRKQQAPDWIQQRKTNPTTYDWIEGDLEHSNFSFPPADYTRFSNMSCVDLFEEFFDDETLEYLVKETQHYAHFLTEADPQITVSELRCFFGILILSGYNTLPSKRMYWETHEDVKNTMVSNSMRRNRFLQIQRFLHFADNTAPNSEDKVWKIRPLMDRLKKKCLTNFVPTESLSYDESMIRYYGHHGCKQFIRSKPIRFGYKVWCLNTSDGYLVDFDLYQDKTERGDSDYDSLFGKAASPLVLMLDELPTKRVPFTILHGQLVYRSEFIRLPETFRIWCSWHHKREQSTKVMSIT